MNAKEAKKLADHNNSIMVIGGPLKMVIQRITDASHKGEYCLYNPLEGIELSGIQHDLLVKKVREMGYKYEYHSDPDFGNPCSSSYEELSW